MTLKNKCLLIIFLLGVLGTDLLAQLTSDSLPMQLQGGFIEEKLGESLSLNTEFYTSEGSKVPLSEFIDDTVPVIITLNYYNCPMLCTLTLNGLLDGLRDLDLNLGKDFRIVTISIDPTEKPELAKINKKGYLSRYDRTIAMENSKSWSFLTGEEKSIKKTAEELGFGYRYDDSIGEYIHTSSIMFLSPSGVITRYMNDVKFLAFDIKKALIESGEGKVGSRMENFIFFNCYQYDPERGSYVPSAWKLMRLGGISTVIFIVIGILFLNRLESKSSEITEGGSF
tara:strand:+ start:136 stop:984 length:849 start_codon:yes stop_codon:yes gene_type:complete